MTAQHDEPAGPGRPGPPVPLLGARIDPVTLEQAVARVLELARRPPGLVVTPNVDHLVLLSEDEALRRAYAAASLQLCDGAPVLALARLCGRPLPGRVTGADLMGEVCAAAAEEGLRVFVAGGAPEVLERGTAVLRERYPGLQVTGHSPPMGFEGSEHDLELQRRIREEDPDIVMVCLGAPRAEVWSAAQMARHPAVYLCVGAAIDFAAGTKSRAPRLVQRAGMEWAYRLLQEPGRLWKRYLVRDAAFLPLAARELRTSVVQRRQEREGRAGGSSPLP